MSGDHQAGLKSLAECQEPITRTCSVLERALLSIALAEAHLADSNKQESLRLLSKARAQCRQAGAVLFEKFVLQELAMRHPSHTH
ncbi:hypothetical protein ANCDUO_21142, partial [Ancylostoma duodenale]